MPDAVLRLKTKLRTALSVLYSQPPGGYGPAPWGGQPAPQQYQQPMYQPPPQYYPPPSAPRRASKGLWPTIALAAIGMVLLVLALAMPLYTMSGKSTSGSYNMEATRTISVSGIEESAREGSTYNTENFDWEKYTNEYKSAHQGSSPKLPQLYQLMFILLLIGMVMAVVAMPVALAAGYFGKGPPKLAAGLLGVGAALAFVAIAYMFVAHPGAVQSDYGEYFKDVLGDRAGPHTKFIGETTWSSYGTTNTATWGPALGWFMALIGGILMIAGAATGARINRPAPAGGAPPGPPMGAPGQYYPPEQPGYGPGPVQPGYTPPPYAPPPQQPGYAPPPVPPPQPPEWK